jgi:hypothetical protein
VVIQAFWSYRVDDDEGDEGRITTLARAIAAEYSALTGGEIEIFLDVEKIAWGDQWRDKIDRAVADAAFFIPVLTPRYFRSEHCRDEYTSFVSKARMFGMTDRVLPLMYINFSQLPEVSSDPLASDLLGLQSKDITSLRWLSVGSREFRTVVHEITSDIIRLAGTSGGQGTDAALGNGSVQPVETAVENIEQGLLDLVAAAEVAMPEMVLAMTKISDGIESIGEVATLRAPALVQAQSASAKLAQAAIIAQEFESGALQIEEGANEFAKTVLTTDAGVRAIFSWPIDQADQTEVDAHRVFTEQIQELRTNAVQAFDQLEEFRGTMAGVIGLSNALSGVLRKIDRSLVRFIDSRRVIDGWGKDDRSPALAG